ncbi:MAG TPA: hypothetical protein VNK05_14030, partial [Chloroflexota bacterium]|nr:hypothetical protein [Chloroflexota bacterium]
MEATTQTFTLTTGSTVSDGVPAPGAGNIEAAGDTDVYTLTASAGARVFFQGIDTRPQGGTCAPRWQLRDAADTLVFDSPICSVPGIQTLSLGGAYTLTVAAAAGATGTYSFQTYAVPGPQIFPLTIGSTVSNGVPSGGAGNIEVVGAADIYTFTAVAGDRVFFQGIDTRPQGGTCAPRWQLRDAATALVFDSPICSVPGIQTLSLGGTYTLTVAAGSTDPSTGTYSFRTFAVPAPQTFAISIGDTVSNGVPAPGAGNIESVGAADVYTFTAAPGELVTFEGIDTRPQGGTCAPRWQLRDAANTQVFDAPLCSAPTARTLALGGTYTLTVAPSGTDTSTGTYSFRLTSSTPTPTRTPTSTATATGAPPTATNTPTATPVPPTATNT